MNRQPSQMKERSASFVMKPRLFLLISPFSKRSGVDIDFTDFEPAFVLSGDLLEDRRKHLARSAPGGPEVYNYRNIGFEYFLFEIVFGDGDLCHGSILL